METAFTLTNLNFGYASVSAPRGTNLLAACADIRQSIDDLFDVA
jgi:hypothetical protein